MDANIKYAGTTLLLFFRCMHFYVRALLLVALTSPFVTMTIDNGFPTNVVANLIVDTTTATTAL